MKTMKTESIGKFRRAGTAALLAVVSAMPATVVAEETKEEPWPEIERAPWYFQPDGNDDLEWATGAYPHGLDGEWRTYGECDFWYECGGRRGFWTDPFAIWADGTPRGVEIYDPGTDAWYWLDCIASGLKATDKEVWIPYVYQDEEPYSTGGKWVLYDKDGRMVKGWHTDARGTYWFDPETGAMAKGDMVIDGKEYHFDKVTGLLDEGQKNPSVPSPSNNAINDSIPPKYLDRDVYGVVGTVAGTVVSRKGERLAGFLDPITGTVSYHSAYSMRRSSGNLQYLVEQRPFDSYDEAVAWAESYFDSNHKYSTGADGIERCGIPGGGWNLEWIGDFDGDDGKHLYTVSITISHQLTWGGVEALPWLWDLE